MTMSSEAHASPQAQARKSKVMDVQEAIATLVPDRCESLWIGGMHMHNVPMALVRECIRQGKRFGTLYAAPSASFAADLLVGAGAVERVVVGYLGFEHMGLAPAFRRVVESGQERLQVVEADSGSVVLGLQAGAWGQPFAPLPRGLERTDLPSASPDLYKWVADPFTGDRYLAVQAIRPQVALVHCQQADPFGNGLHRGSPFVDRLLALAARTLIMQVEGLVDNNQIVRAPQQTAIPGFLTDALVVVPFGCHPCSSHRYYNYDEVHLRLYMKAAATHDGFQDYLRRFVLEPQDQEDYMRRVQQEDWSAVEGA